MLAKLLFEEIKAAAERFDQAWKENWVLTAGQGPLKGSFLSRAIHFNTNYSWCWFLSLPSSLYKRNVWKSEDKKLLNHHLSHKWWHHQLLSPPPPETTHMLSDWVVLLVTWWRHWHVSCCVSENGTLTVTTWWCWCRFSSSCPCRCSGT